MRMTHPERPGFLRDHSLAADVLLRHKHEEEDEEKDEHDGKNKNDDDDEENDRGYLE